MTTKLLTAKEVSKHYGLKLARVYELTRDRHLPFVLLGARQYRYSANAIEEFINRGGNLAQPANRKETDGDE